MNTQTPQGAKEFSEFDIATNKKLYKFAYEPLPRTFGCLHVPPKNCVSLEVYDDDGPEGFWLEIYFERSYQAVQFLIDNFSGDKTKDFNYQIQSYWSK